MIASAVVGARSLPGVRIRLNHLLTDLNSGRSCLWLLPRKMLEGPDSPADHLFDELLNELHDFVLLPSDDPDGPPPVRPRAPARVAVPDSGLWSGLAPALDYDDGLADLFSAAPVSGPAEPETVPAPPTEAEALADLLERLAKELGLQSDGAQESDDTAGDVLARLAGGRNGPTETRPVIVRAWREAVPSATGHLLRRLVATGKEAGIPPARGPRALVVASTEDLPPGLPGQLARENIAVHWWWGATGRLDTATVVALARPPLKSVLDRQHLYESIVQATVTEVCGPFLDVAAALAARWQDGRPETLPDALHDVLADSPVPDGGLPETTEGARNPARRPAESLLPAWNAAAVDSWEGRLRHHPGHDLQREHAVASRVWLAQNQVLLPLLDEARERFAATVRSRARIPLQQLAEEYCSRRGTDAVVTESPDSLIETMELGAMWGAHRDGATALTPKERRHLRVLREARNLLAHRTPLDGDRLHRLIMELYR
ncbi:hypothetical protein [Streptomyces sp. HB2AG]|uniref:hypothetical protein n=1 Tax=Streptomyces sp. HB2AG TaxID=2983400 RepID=UPI0022AA2A9E|nr:hypothetical protein [Streptomyces sp. HB2AG]MCZ2526186.1 hypothetical protein [Streptomyces sp. HB2AG]